MAVRENAARLKSIVVGTDFSVCAARALAHAVSLAQLSGAKLHLVHVLLEPVQALDVAAALGYTQRCRAHIVVDIISDKYGRHLRRAVDAVSSLIMTVFFFLVAKALFYWGLSLSESGEVSETLKIVYHPFVFCVSAGFAMLSVTCFAETARAAFNIRTEETE